MATEYEAEQLHKFKDGTVSLQNIHTPALYFVWDHHNNAVYCGLNAYLYRRSHTKQLCDVAPSKKSM